MKNKTSPVRSFFVAFGTSIFVEVVRYQLYPQSYANQKVIGLILFCFILNVIYHLWGTSDSGIKTGISAFYNQATLPYSIAAIIAAVKLFLRGTIPSPPLL